MTQQQAADRVTSTALADRVLAPDLARGSMLLLIALANAHFFLHGHEIGVRSYPLEGSSADRAVTWLLMTFVDGRAYPLFGLLFGYGMVQLAQRQERAGSSVSATKALLRRRSRWLLLFGLLHALLLFSGDILGAYGLLGLVLAGMAVTASDRRLLVGAAVGLVPLALLGVGHVMTPAGATAAFWSYGTTDPLWAAGFRAGEWVMLTLFMVLSVAGAVLAGAWGARRRLLGEPARHRRLLRVGAVVGLGLAALRAQPLALMAAQVWTDPPVAVVLAAAVLHAVSGYAGGVGYACVAGLVAVAVPDRRGPVVGALVATGQRSLTCYLAQSVVFVALLASYGGGLGDDLGVASVAVVAVLTWLATVAMAVLMARAGMRGPFERLLRHLTYRPTSRPGTATA
ncbi:DUF418 domain-containing protein [Aquipuribacter sp. MA13-6]|uniref:DUF418 domain-containing protein n=1 Tax=unclassified Aquipuribacter TaxID=2635084 RepID=UPI003EEB4F3B